MTCTTGTIIAAETTAKRSHIYLDGQFLTALLKVKLCCMIYALSDTKYLLKSNEIRFGNQSVVGRNDGSKNFFIL